MVELVSSRGRQLTPDLTRSNQLALGIAQQFKEQKVEQANTEEAAQIQGILTKQNLQELLDSPESMQQFLRLNELKPGSGDALIDLLAAGDELQAREAATKISESARIFNNLVVTEQQFGSGAVADQLREVILDKQEAGDDPAEISELQKILVMPADQRAAAINTQRALAGEALRIPDVANLVSVSAGARLADPITGEVRLEAVPEDEDALTAKQRSDIEFREREFAGKLKEAEKTEAGKTALIRSAQAATRQNAERVTTQIDDILGTGEGGNGIGLVVSGNVGRLGQIARTAGPTGEAGQLSRQIETIKSNLGIEQLLQIKAQGGTFGQLSDRELTVLQTRIANLDMAAGADELRRNLELVKESYTRLIDNLDAEGIDLSLFGGGSTTLANGDPKSTADSFIR